MLDNLRFVFLGLSITSSWGNGHATTYRGLVNALVRRGHEVLFLERDVPWYASHRDLSGIAGARVELYESVADLQGRFARDIQLADVVIVGSFVPDGQAVGQWVRQAALGLVAFYDIDTPVTLAALEADRCAYLSRRQLPFYDLYLSFTGGPALRRLARLGARAVRPLYCAVDPAQHAPVTEETRWDLGYLGTYAPDRQPSLEALLIRVAERWPAGRFVVAGPLYPESVEWPANVTRIDHVAPGDHSRFYGGQRFALNLTRADMRRLGYSPSVRLFEAAACGAAILTDDWDGLDTFFEPGREILRVRSARDVERAILETPEAERAALGHAARARVLSAHTASHRAEALEEYASELLGIAVSATPSDMVAPRSGRQRDGATRLHAGRGVLRAGDKKDLTA